MKNKLRFGLIAAIPIIICIVAVAIRVTVPKSDTVTIEGDIEVDVRPYYVQVTGEVKSLSVGVGQTVSKGDILLILDDSQASFELTQMENAFIKAQAALRDLNEIDNQELRQAQIKIAKSNVTIAGESLTAAQEVLARLQEEYASLEILFNAELVAQAELDAMADSVAAQEKAVAIATAQLDIAKEQLVIAGIDTQTDMTEKITMAQADVEDRKSVV